VQPVVDSYGLLGGSSLRSISRRSPRKDAMTTLLLWPLHAWRGTGLVDV